MNVQSDEVIELDEWQWGQNIDKNSKTVKLGILIIARRVDGPGKERDWTWKDPCRKRRKQMNGVEERRRLWQQRSSMSLYIGQNLKEK